MTESNAWDFDIINRDVVRYRDMAKFAGTEATETVVTQKEGVDVTATLAASIAAGEPVWVIRTGVPANQSRT